MGHFMRYGLFCRTTKLFIEGSRLKHLKGIHQLPKLLVPDKIGYEHDSTSEKSSSKKLDDDDVFPDDLVKFKNEGKVKLPRSSVKSEDFSGSRADDPNTFGTLSKKNPYVLGIQDGTVDDEDEDKFVSELPNYYQQKKYVDMIKKFLKQRRFADALAVLEDTMLKEHRVKPEYYVYSILISYCGYTGYSKMAFKLYNEMKRRDLPVKSSVYTSLFNSFANSPYPTDGLKKTKHLLRLMDEKNVTPNQINCHAIIKAFARCGAVEEAFKFVDFMMQKKMKLSEETFSFIFHACISDKEAGFRHALLVYKKMMQYQMKPDVIHFNLMLHCIRDCSLGDSDSMIDLLKTIGVENVDKLTTELKKPIDFVASEGYPWEEDADSTAVIVSGSSLSSPQDIDMTREVVRASEALLPNLLSQKPSLGCIVSLFEINTPQDRLFLLGGSDGFLQEMWKQNAKPNIKTISLLLECSPQTCTAELALLKKMSQLDLKPDLLFFNTLIKRRCFRNQYAEAKEILPMLSSHGHHPDLMTYTNLAMACRQKEDAYQLLKAVEDSGLRPGIELITNLFGCASCTYNISYVQLIFDVIDYEDMKVNSIFLKKSDDFYHKCQRVLKVRPEKFNPKALISLEKFCNMYVKWKDNIEVEDDSKNPWQHLRERHSDSQTDKEFFSQYVEKEKIGAKFPRLGPDTVPKRHKFKVKLLKEENQNVPKGISSRKSRREIEKLEGITSVSFQKSIQRES